MSFKKLLIANRGEIAICIARAVADAGIATVAIHPAVLPFLLEYPRANGPSLGQGGAAYTFPFDQRLDEDFVQGRLDYHLSGASQFFGRYTFDTADQLLPTDYPQFPRSFISRNQFFTGEYRRIASDRTLSTFRVGFSRTRIGQLVEVHDLGTELLRELEDARLGARRHQAEDRAWRADLEQRGE